MRLLFLLVAVVFASSVAAEKANQYVYEISCAGNANVGYYVVEVSAYVSKKKEINNDVVKKCALHGVLFKGFSGKDGCHSQRQMLTNYDGKHSALIENLISSEYGKYVETIGVPVKVVKLNKRYKITTIVQVSKDLLRKDLEKAGVIRKLGF